MGKPKSSKNSVTKKQPEVSHKRIDPPRGFWSVCVLLAVFGIFVATIHWLFGAAALPNVFVGNTEVGQLSAGQIKQVVQQQEQQLKVIFQDGSTQVTVPVSDLGVVIDADATVKQAMRARRSSNVVDNLELWKTQTVPLVYHNDAGVLKEYIVQHFPKVYVDPQDAQLVFNTQTNQFDIQSGTLGKGFDITMFEAALPDLAKSPRTIVLPLSTVPVQPLITDKALIAVQQQANKQVALQVQFTKDGRTAYKVTPADIAAWMHFPPDPTKGTVAPEIDKGQIQQFMEQTVAGKVTNVPVDRKVIVDSSNGSQFVVQQGQVGNQLKDADKLADAVYTSLTTGQPLSQELSIEEAPFKTVTISGSGRWIEVDLSRQTATLYIGNQPVQTFLISSGRAATPTEIGTFYVYRKLPMDTMTGTILGEYYYIPNIPWISYFDGGEAFHGTYWHHNFGHPMSHGCINMTIADAKIVYDFAPVGTKVVVHN